MHKTVLLKHEYLYSIRKKDIPFKKLAAQKLFGILYVASADRKFY